MEQEQQTPHKRRVRYKGKYPKKFEEKYKELQPEKYQDTIEHVIKKGNTPAGMHISIMVQEIQLGEAEEGGLAVLPVHLQFLSKRNKQRIIDRIKQAHETDDDESAH